MTTDVLMATWNRLEFVRFSLGMLRRHTNWSMVRRLVIIDDGSTDGTREWLREVTADLGVSCAVSYRETNRLGGAPAIMNHYMAEYSTGAQRVAKIDSDIAMPPRWLEDAALIMDGNPNLELLGLAAGWTGQEGVDPTYKPTLHIGGVGLLRVDSFSDRKPLYAKGVHGFTSWQERNAVLAGWAVPDVQAVQLDLVPIDPWASLARDYVAAGWAREWPPYAHASGWWRDWPTTEELWA